ncbi:MAG: hypothetical protein AAFV90_28900 [Cyanobacteria bacterium J06634_5]
MKSVKSVEIKTIEKEKSGTVSVYVSQTSHETVQMEVTQGVLDEIFVPNKQTHQVFVVRGKVVLVVWENQQPRDIHLDEKSSKVVVIPPDVCYGFINLHVEPSLVVNAVLHDQGSEYQLEHHPVENPLAYDSVVHREDVVSHKDVISRKDVVPANVTEKNSARRFESNDCALTDSDSHLARKPLLATG